jgi:hypothetical protein
MYINTMLYISAIASILNLRLKALEVAASYLLSILSQK